MSNSGEQHLMEAWHDEGIEGDDVDFRYPYYSRMRGEEVNETADIVVTEYKWFSVKRSEVIAEIKQKIAIARNSHTRHP